MLVLIYAYPLEVSKPQKKLVIVSLVLAAVAQLLGLIDPIIFGKIIDDYAINPGSR